MTNSALASIARELCGSRYGASCVVGIGLLADGDDGFAVHENDRIRAAAVV